MIKESVIELIISQLTAEGYEDSFSTEQSEYWHYINSDSFKGFTEEEDQLLFFVSSVIFHSVKHNNKSSQEFDIENFQKIEESNWSLREKNKSWPDAKDAFFETYREEDLLAFVEDMLAEEERTISDVAEEIIFITAKSYIDILLTQN